MFKKLSFIPALISVCSADQLHPPARVRVSSELIQQMFHTGDQKLIESFQGLSITSPIEIEIDENSTIGLKDLTANMQTKSGDLENYDFTMILSDPISGVYGKDLKVQGKASNLEGESFDYEADLNDFSIDINMIAETDKKILQFNKSARKFESSGLVVNIGEIKSSVDITPKISQLVQATVKDLIINEYNTIWAGDIRTLSSLPVESLMPIMFLKNMASMMNEFTITDEYIEFGYDPDFGRKKPSARKNSMLKEIDSQFAEIEEGQDKSAVSLIVDENFINTHLLEFVMIDKSISLEQYLKMDPRTRPISKQLSTRLLETVFPDLVKEYGRKKFDIMFSMSHNLIKDKLEGARITGFALDKNGNFRLTLNLFAQLLIDRTGGGEWQNAREIYIGLAAKGKLVIKDTAAGQQTLMLVAKSAEVSNIKVLDKAGEEVVVEQMMITSVMNVQFEQLIGMIKPYQIPLKNPPTPKELECLGFTLSDLMVHFKKGFLEIGCGYKMVKVPSDPALCEDFMNTLRNGPTELFKQAEKFMKQPKSMMKDQKELAGGRVVPKNKEEEEDSDVEVIEVQNQKKLLNEDL